MNEQNASSTTPSDRQRTFRAVAPVLLVRDIQASAAWWQEKVGFDPAELWGDPPTFGMVHRDGLTVMLQRAPADHSIVPHWQVVKSIWNVYFWVNDIKGLYENCLRRGAVVDYELTEKPYGCLEFGLRDPDNHDIGFGQITRPQSS